MDHNNKNWLWRKKSTERMIVASDKVDLSPTRNEDEMQELLTAKAALEKDLKSANDKLSSCLSECNTKDGTIKKHVKMAEEAMAGWEDAEAKAATLKQELDAVSQQRASGEERIAHVEEALKKSMQQLKFVREEQERRVHDAVMKASMEFEHSEKIMEDKLAETSKRNAELVSENTHLSKVILAKEKTIEDLIQQKAQVETDITAMMSRLTTSEKENASLEYEVQVLEKELEIRNEEREFNRRTANASHKQHLENVKKIAKLESECQRLRVLVRKRLPGPAALAKMRSEVDVLARDSAGRRRTKSSLNGFAADSTDENSQDTFNKQVNFLTEQLCAVEEENNSLKEALNRKANELQVSRSMYARTASKLSQVESHLDELPKGQTSIDPSRRGRSGFAPYAHSHAASMSDLDSDDKISCAESWASALISELEHFKHGNQRGSPSGKTVGASEISLMDDFAEMEKLAIVSVDNKTRSPHVSEQAITTQRKPYETVEDVRAALEDTSQGHAESINSKESAKQIDTSNSADVCKQISANPINKCSLMDSSCGIKDDNALLTHTQTDLGKSILKIVEIVEGITLPHYGALDSSPSSSDNTVRVFQWKTSELGAVLQKFVHTCYDLLNGKSDVNSFAKELTSALDWVMNHCFSLQDVSSTKDEIKKHLELDETRSESEAEVGFISQPEVNKISRNNEQLSNMPMVSNATGLQKSSQKDEFQHVTIDENMKENLAQFPAAKAELTEAHRECSSLEMEHEKNCSCDELEATCFELHLKSVKKNTVPDQEETQLRSEWEITAASEKLAECQETILNLGKQLKALAKQNDTSHLDKPISTPAETTNIASSTTPVTPRKLTKERSSLLDQMLAEDKAKTRDSDSISPKLKQSEYDSSVLVPNEVKEPLEKILFLNGSNHQGDNGVTSSLAIVPSKKQGVNLWRKLLWRKRKSSVKRPPLPFAPQNHRIEEKIPSLGF